MTTTMRPIRVLIVDDHTVVRIGLRSLLGHAAGFRVVGEAGTVAEALALTERSTPDVVLMDIRMPNLDGIESTRRIKNQLPSTSVIVLTIYDNDAYVVDAIRAGASGYLLKDASKDLLIHTIHAVNSGGMLVKTSLLREAVLSLSDASSDQLKRKQVDTTALGGLTPREREVLRLLIRGRSNKEIGQALCIGEDTAKKHVQTIMMKMRVSDRTQAAVKAVRAGLADSSADEEAY